jgi:hypothetical protein
MNSFLTRLKHPNIVRVRGTVGRPGHDNFMIMMDCLNLTLREKIVEWDYDTKIRRNATQNVFTRIFHIGSHRRFQPADSSKINPAMMQVHTEKLMAAYDLVRGMKFLHSHRYVFEDGYVGNMCLFSLDWPNPTLYTFLAEYFIETSSRKILHLMFEEGSRYLTWA